MKDFLLESLRELQNTLLVLMEQAKRTQVPEGAYLEWALTDVITAYLDLRADVTTWRDALAVYTIARNVKRECDWAVFEVDQAGNGVYQYFKWRAQNEAQP